MYRHFENNDPQYKKQGDRANAKVNISGKLGYQAHNCCAKERRNIAQTNARLSFEGAISRLLQLIIPFNACASRIRFHLPGLKLADVYVKICKIE